jgi:hypothetical protein
MNKVKLLIIRRSSLTKQKILWFHITMQNMEKEGLLA